MTRIPMTVETLPIAGEEVAGGEPHEVRSPWDGRLVGTLPAVGPSETRRGIEAGAAAMHVPLPAHQRARILEVAAGLVRERRAALSELLALEVAKPLASAAVEIDRAVQTLTFAAAAARTLAGTGVPLDAHPSGEGRLGFTLRVPIGVVGAITPFNFPFNLAAHKVGPAIAAGCATILKPSLKAPLSGLALARILYEAGLPPAWLSVVNGDPEAIVATLLADQRVRLLTFTGSSQVGWSLVEKAPRRRVCLELGNSTPLIVCADADLDAAATVAATSGFGFAGQSCISVQRILVASSVREDFAERLVAAARAQRFGPPLEAGVTLSAVIDSAARDRVDEWVAEACDRGGRELVGGLADRGNRLPTVLDAVPTDARVWEREVFGPVVALRPFADLDEAIDLANGTDYGLQAGIFTRDLATALTAAERLTFGGVTINETPSFRVDQMPYGGTKVSGNTREGPAHTIMEMTEERLVVIGR